MRMSTSGGGIYSSGESSGADVVVTDADHYFTQKVIRRSGQNILYRGRVLEPGDRMTWWAYRPSINPWVIYTYEMSMDNYGLARNGQTIYAEGDIRESWAVSPLGFVILYIGLHLYRGNSSVIPMPNLLNQWNSWQIK
jgi:hypothetical protein